MNIITAHTVRTQTRQRLLSRMDHDDYRLYRTAETEYHRQLAMLRDAVMVLCHLGGGTLVLIGLFRGPTSLAVAGIALVLAVLVVALVNFKERNRIGSGAQDNITATLTEILDNEQARRS